MARPRTTQLLPRLNFSFRQSYLYYVVAYNGKQAVPKSTGLKIDAGESWDKKAKTIKGNEVKADTLLKLKDDLSTIYHTSSRSNKTLTAKTLGEYLTKKRDYKDDIPSLISATDAFIASRKEMADNGEIVPKTYRDYFVRKRHLIDFLTHQYKSENVALDELKPVLGKQFEGFLRLKKGLQTETVRKIVWFLSAVLEYAKDNEWTNRNVLDGYKKPKSERKEIVYLKDDELTKIKQLTLLEPTTEMVRDFFVFTCYTGLNHVDLMKLITADITTDTDGNKCIERGRSKNELPTFIPVAANVLPIVERYGQKDAKTDLVFPQISLDKYNKHLHIIRGIAGIERVKITSKIGRSTCATILVNQGVSIEIIMKIMGHKKPETLLRYYASIHESTTIKAVQTAFTNHLNEQNNEPNTNTKPAN